MSDQKQPLHLRIEKPIYGGAGLARNQGKAIFIPYTLPGELVTASVTHSKASFAEASLATILEPSPDRTAPPCPWFARCGGCHYQHAAYPAQLAIKAAILEETLTRARLTDLPAILTHPSQPFAYRNRIRLHLDPIHSTLGYRERASHRLLPISQCPIAAPELELALRALTAVSVNQHCGAYFSQAELSVNHNGSELLLALWLRDHAAPAEAAARLARLCEALQPALPTLKGAGIHTPAPNAQEGRNRGNRHSTNPAQRNTRDSDRDSSIPEDSPSTLLATWGAPTMTYQAAALDFRVSLGAFFQVNRTSIDQLVALATGNRIGELAWDLYAGVGLFSRALTAHFAQVVAVEGAPISSSDLRANLRTNPANTPHRAVQSSTLDFLRLETARETARPHKPARRTPDFVLVDPPRAGLGEETTRLLTQIGPSDVTYVSCDPATLARDLSALVNSGYQLKQLHLIDLFPQTFHLETVAMLSRR